MLARSAKHVFPLLLAGLTGCSSCGKKGEETPVPPPPTRGAATSDEFSNGLGQARGLAEELAPTSAKWRRVFALDDKRLILAGDTPDLAIALLTDDGGRTWNAVKGPRDAWCTWSALIDGSLALGTGARDGAANGFATIEGGRIALTSIDSPVLTTPTPFFPTPKGPAKGLFAIDSGVLALLAPDSAAIVAEPAPKKPSIFYAGKPGAEAVDQLKLPAGEKFIPVPYGRPPMLLSIKGKDLFQRPFPMAGKPLDKPVKVAGITATPALLGELSAPPACESGAYSFQRIKQGKRIHLLGVSNEKIVSFPLPEATMPTTKIGCGAGKVVIETIQEKTGVPATWDSQPDIPMLVTCDLAGKCTAPQNPAFRIWPEKHEREIVSAPTQGGTLGVLTAHAGNRWGVYLAQSNEGAIFDRPRVIGEGNGDRGQIEVGAFASLGKRALILISGDVTGTSRRGWFVMVSDDGGVTWNPP